MTVIGVRDMVGALASYTRGALSSDGGLWLILMDGLLLIPLGMAAFFYPVVAVLIGAALAAGTVGAVALSRAKFTRQTSPAYPPEMRPGVTNSGLPGLLSETRQSMESTFEHAIFHSSVPVLVDFWAPWCGPCRVQLPIVEEISRGEAGRARVVKVNVDEQPELAERFRIASIPTLLVFSNGQVRERFVGVQSAATLRAALRAAATA